MRRGLWVRSYRLISRFALALVLVTPIAPAVILQKGAIEVQLSRLQPDE